MPVTKAKRRLNLEHYRAQERERRRTQRARVREKVATYKAERGCSRCPERRPDALHFHHPDRSIKQRTVQAAIATQSETRVWEEIGRCEILCANCHAVEHAEEARARWMKEENQNEF